MIAHAQNDPEREVCGLLLGTPGNVRTAMGADNASADPSREFEIAADALFSAIRDERQGGPALLGYYHSHPSGRIEPSETDCERAARDGKLWLIIARGDIRSWRSDAAGFVPVRLIRDPLPCRGLPGDSVSATRPS